MLGAWLDNASIWMHLRRGWVSVPEARKIAPLGVSRDYILAEIRRTAEANGGAALGRERFRAETGLRDGDWERYWARWSDAVKEAGFAPNTMQGRYADEDLLRPFAAEVRRFGRIPTLRELEIRRREGAPLPTTTVFERWPKRELVARALTYCRDQPDLADIAAILEPAVAEAARATEAAAREEADGTDDVEFGFVYLVKVGSHYKLGRTNSVGRRERELAIQLPDPAATVHSIKTDDPAGIEAYWHRRFADRRGNGEFALTPADVRAFKRRKFM